MFEQTPFQTETFKGHVMLVITPTPKGKTYGGIQFGLSKAKAVLAQRDNLAAFIRGAEIEGQTWIFEGKRCFKVPVGNYALLAKGEKFWVAVHAKINEVAAFVKEYDKGEVKAA